MEGEGEKQGGTEEGRRERERRGEREGGRRKGRDLLRIETTIAQSAPPDDLTHAHLCK